MFLGITQYKKEGLDAGFVKMTFFGYFKGNVVPVRLFLTALISGAEQNIIVSPRTVV